MAIDKIETDSLASGLVAPTATALTTASGSAPSYSARAWVNFNGQGTPAIRASGNVSSITDIGTGSYRVNFTVAMVDANYSFSGITGWNPGVEPSCLVGTSSTGLTTGYAVVYTLTNGGDTTYDLSQVLVSFFR